ncbi:hypothetical protein PoB_007598700 [Plakobranchus ocellatus]|uniref:Uncharacterized protein n=1 Tax=Plakobranchus ocellatus TaxID=259542 RepID=A0AAV4DYT3_9GAST|nr:hypothetical protein PoB_007598700 [Plakobranchus ocellatus]
MQTRAAARHVHAHTVPVSLTNPELGTRIQISSTEQSTQLVTTSALPPPAQLVTTSAPPSPPAQLVTTSAPPSPPGQLVTSSALPVQLVYTSAPPPPAQLGNLPLYEPLAYSSTNSESVTFNYVIQLMNQ